MPPTQESNETRHEKARALAATIYPQHHRRLLAIATRNSPNPQDAEEALHDAFALFIDHFDPSSEAPPLAWLTLTLKRRCWATCRNELPLQTNPDTTEATTPQRQNRPPDELAEIADTATKLRKGFQRLKPQERKALSLLALGYSYQDICKATGWTYTKVNRCITEGRAALRAHKP